ncbi:hypothetical protein Purlil1_5987 [Purpureocillium lilacinum]|uniref:Uncharacterized protein n=1 Tax=Purpureocillium lilacinum TaxID=33203 RepID=A0ABR0C0T3_PURLI|nr:hypothetical protein Purlil1_5987 [Purpureocillium lilacinum]
MVRAQRHEAKNRGSVRYEGPGPCWAGHEEQEEATPDDSFRDDGIKGPSGAAAREGEGAAVRRWRAGDGQHGRPASARIVEGHESKTRYYGARSDRKQDGTGVAGHARGWSLAPVAQRERENIATRDCISGVMRKSAPAGKGKCHGGHASTQLGRARVRVHGGRANGQHGTAAQQPPGITAWLATSLYELVVSRHITLLSIAEPNTP